MVLPPLSGDRHRQLLAMFPRAAKAAAAGVHHINKGALKTLHSGFWAVFLCESLRIRSYHHTIRYEQEALKQYVQVFELFRLRVSEEATRYVPLS